MSVAAAPGQSSLSLRALCWDLDDTLGSFVRVQHEMVGYRTPEGESPLGTRPGIVPVLSELSCSGFVHFVTSTGKHAYVTAALERTGLISHFREVFGREHVSLGTGGKCYRVVAERMGLSDVQARESMAVVGDAGTDMPSDIEGLVFIHQPRGRDFAAIVVALILRHLGNSIRSGFERLYARSDGRPIDLGQGIRVLLVRAKARTLITEVRPLLNQLQARGFRLDAATRAIILELAGEA